jgi:hypothetical protein
MANGSDIEVRFFALKLLLAHLFLLIDLPIN